MEIQLDETTLHAILSAMPEAPTTPRQPRPKATNTIVPLGRKGLFPKK